MRTLGDLSTILKSFFFPVQLAPLDPSPKPSPQGCLSSMRGRARKSPEVGRGDRGTRGESWCFTARHGRKNHTPPPPPPTMKIFWINSLDLGKTFQRRKPVKYQECGSKLFDGGWQKKEFLRRAGPPGRIGSSGRAQRKSTLVRKLEQVVRWLRVCPPDRDIGPTPRHLGSRRKDNNKIFLESTRNIRQVKILNQEVPKYHTGI